MWTDDGRYICTRYHAVRAGSGYCLQCLTPVRCTTKVRANYLQLPGENGLVAAWASRGLAPRLAAPSERGEPI
eukprot:8333136-Pyramimonas_sp.AAC.1